MNMGTTSYFDKLYNFGNSIVTRSNNLKSSNNSRREFFSENKFIHSYDVENLKQWVELSALGEAKRFHCF